MKTCKYCGGEVSDTAKKCKYCGEWLNEENDKTTINKNRIQKQTDSKAKNTKITAILLSIVILTIFITGVIFGLNKYIEYLDAATNETFMVNYSNDVKTINIIEKLYNFKMQKAYDKYIIDYANEIANNYGVSNSCGIYRLLSDTDSYGEITQASSYLGKSKLFSNCKCSENEEKKCEKQDLEEIAELHGGISLDCAKSLKNEYQYNSEDNLDENGNNYKYQSLCTAEEKQKMEESSIKKLAESFGITLDCAKAWDNRVYRDNYIVFDMSKCSQKELQSIKKDMSKQETYESEEPLYTKGMPPSLILKGIPIMCYKYANNGDNRRCSEKQLKIIQDFFKQNPDILHSYISGFGY